MSYANALAVYDGSAGEFIGSGVSREAFLVGNEVYKVENPYGGVGVNYSEAAASAFMRENFKIPGILWLNFILHKMPDGSFISEAPFIPESEGVYNHPQYNFLYRLGQDMDIGDFGANNIRVFKNFLIPIDLGYWALTGKKFWLPETWIQLWERRRYWQDDAEQWR